MSAKANHFKIGVFVIAAIALFVFGLIAFGARSFFQTKTTFETAVEGDVYGLSTGSRVELRGVPIGQVTHIAFGWSEYPKSRKSFVIVEFQVTKQILSAESGADMEAVLKTAIRNGLRAMVKAQSITGTSLLALEFLDPVRNPAPVIDFAPEHYYIPSAPGQITRMLEAIENTLRNFEQLDFRSVAASVTNALGAATKLAEKIERLDLAKLGTNADSLITEAKVTNHKLQGTLDEIRQTIADLKLNQVGSNADKLLLGLQETNDKLQRVLNNVGNLPLQQTVEEARESFESLNQVLHELKQYPSGFILGDPPHPATSVQPPK